VVGFWEAPYFLNFSTQYKLAPFTNCGEGSIGKNRSQDGKGVGADVQEFVDLEESAREVTEILTHNMSPNCIW